MAETTDNLEVAEPEAPAAEGDAGKLSQKDVNSITEWLTTRSKNARCPVCENTPTNWIVGEHLIHGQAYTGGSLVIGGTSYPQAFAVCDNCFYVRTFMALPMELDALKKEQDA